MADPLRARADNAILAALEETAVLAAGKAGRIQLEEFRRAKRVEEVLEHDLKIELDDRCERAILETIVSRFPDHSVISEEGGSRTGSEEFLWIVDPLDGTVNYFHGLPFFCSSVACYSQGGIHAEGRDAAGAGEGGDRAPRQNRADPRRSRPGQPLVGVVYTPFMDELFVAVRDRGAACNGRPLRLGAAGELSRALVSMSFNCRSDNLERMTGILQRLLPRIQKVRSFGAAAFDVAQVAAGRLGALVQRGTNLWDFAAARLVLEEAGGVLDAVELPAGSWEIIACNPGIYDELRRVVRPRGSQEAQGDEWTG